MPCKRRRLLRVNLDESERTALNGREEIPERFEVDLKFLHRGPHSPSDVVTFNSPSCRVGEATPRRETPACAADHQPRL